MQTLERGGCLVLGRVRTTQNPNFLLRCTGRAPKSCPNPLYLKGLVLKVERLLAKESFGELK
jgi:hypothetical protein